MMKRPPMLLKGPRKRECTTYLVCFRKGNVSLIIQVDGHGRGVEEDVLVAPAAGHDAVVVAVVRGREDADAGLGVARDVAGGVWEAVGGEPGDGSLWDIVHDYVIVVFFYPFTIERRVWMQTSRQRQFRIAVMIQ